MRLIATACMIAVTGAATANDTTAELGAGGLRFITSDSIELVSEDLYVSPSEVRVSYVFRNISDADETALVAFPLPDIVGNPEWTVALPSGDSDNPFGFITLFNGEPVEVELHQQAFALNIDRTKMLAGFGIPLGPRSDATRAALAEVDDEAAAQLLHAGLVIPMEYDAGDGWQRDLAPVWTLKTAYSWEAAFPAGEEVTVEHRYTPAVGGTVAATFMGDSDYQREQAALYAERYCIEDDIIAAVRRSQTDPDDPYSAPFYEQWIQYVWSTGANWSGPVGTFRLVVDKGAPDSLVSFCWEGEVTKTGPTTFEMVAHDWWPPYGRELDILILDRYEPAQ